MALVTTVDFLTQSNGNFNVLDIKQFFFSFSPVIAL